MPFARRPKLTLATKIIGTVALALLVAFAIAVPWAAEANRAALERQYFERARVTTRLLDAMVRTRADLENADELFGAIQRALWLEPDLLAIEFTAVIDGEAIVVASSVPGRAGAVAGSQHARVVSGATVEQTVATAGGARYVRTLAPVHVSRQVVGTVQADLTLETLDAALAEAVQRWALGGALVGLLLVAVLCVALRGVVLTPIKRLARAVEALTDNRRDVELEVRTDDELGALSAAFNRMTSELRAAEARIEHLAYHDALTGLPNRRYLINRLEHAVAQARRYSRTGVLVYVDLDGFKQVNDSLGHAAGDAVLVATAGRLTGAVREVDCVARIGGDEFVALLEDMEAIRAGGTEAAEVIARKLARTVAEPIVAAGRDARVTASIGVRVFASEDASAETILSDADTAMYRAKTSGHGEVRVWELDGPSSARRRHALREGIRDAIAARAVPVHFQPQVDSVGRVVGAEALLRWSDLQWGPVAPEECVNISDEMGLLPELGQHVVRRACRVLNDSRPGRPGADALARIAINVDGPQLLSADFRSRLRQLVSCSGLPANALELELAERCVVGDLERSWEVMHALREDGFRLVIDDFGVGESSLAYLRRLPVDGIKIDRAFVRDMLAVGDDRAMVGTMVTMAREAGIDVVAEGVETRGQLDALVAMGCGCFQGFYFSEALSEEAFAAVLHANLPIAAH